MKRLYLIPVFFFIFSLCIQNTCPFGLAGKTGYAAQSMHHCPLKAKHTSDKKGSQTHKSTAQYAGQGFLFTLSASAVSVSAPVSEARLAFKTTSIYKNVFLDPPVKPPSPMSSATVA